MEYLAKCGESNIFNLGNGVGFTVKEIIETARKVLGWKPQYTLRQLFQQLGIGI